MRLLKKFPFSTKHGEIIVELGQCFRPNSSTKKIHQFMSKNGYVMWVLAVPVSAVLTFRETESILDEAMAILGYEDERAA